MREEWLDRGSPNALNCFRLVFALLVVFSHSWAFGRFSDNPLDAALWFLGDTAGNAVNGFFIVSGFLITGSWFSRRTTDDYFRARIVRIWPAFVVAFVFSGLIAALAAGAHWFHYLKSIPKQGWFVGVFTLDPFVLERPLSFANNPYPRAVNGPMWTIRIEFCCYIAVALAGAIGVFRKKILVVCFAISAMLLAEYEHSIIPNEAWLHWPRFAAFFSSGSVLYLYREQIPRSSWIAIISSILLCIGSLKFPYFAVPLAGTYLLFYLAYSAPDCINKIGAKNDISYGVYLYGGPLQQLYYSVAVKGDLPMNPWVNFAVVCPLCLGLGWVSWLCIEKPAKNWLRVNTSSNVHN